MYEHLSNFLDSYFHQDWDVDFDSEEDNIRYFVEKNSINVCQQVISDIDHLVMEGFSDKKLGRMLNREIGGEALVIPNEYPKYYNFFRKIRASILFYMEAR